MDTDKKTAEEKLGDEILNHPTIIPCAKEFMEKSGFTIFFPQEGKNKTVIIKVPPKKKR